MICRRKHTANFTTIGNDLFDDERLAADEVGVLSYLLSRPNDWEVRRPALARRWKIGRERIARIMFSLIRYGWIVAKRDRLSNGTFFVIYEVRDQPGPELTVEDAKSATSLVSSDADDAESDDADDGRERVASHPDTGDPDAAQPDTANPLAPYKKELLKPDSPRTESTQDGRGIEWILSRWPVEHVLSRVAAETAYAALTDGQQRTCEQGLEPYLSDCLIQDRKICDLTTYIRERRGERFTTKAASPGRATFPVRSPQWWRWRKYRIATGQSIKFMDHHASNGRSNMWSEPSEWPPALPKPVNTGPPEPQLTQEDEAELAKL